MPGAEFCVAHRRSTGASALDEWESGSVEPNEPSAFRAGVLTGNREQLIESGMLELIAEAGANRAIDTEIGALRLLLLRALAQESLDGDLASTSATVARLTDAIGRALKVRQTLAGGRAAQLEAELVQVLEELGLGGEDGHADARTLPPERGFLVGER